MKCCDASLPATHPEEMHSPSQPLQIPPQAQTDPRPLPPRLITLPTGRLLHSLALKDGLLAFVFVQNSLVHFYSACGLFEHAHSLFAAAARDDRNLVTWNSVINGFAINDQPNDTLTLFRQMLTEDPHIAPDAFTLVGLLSASTELGALALGCRPHTYLLKAGFGSNSHVENALVDLYSKCGRIRDAVGVFDEMGAGRNVVSWTSLVVGLAVNGFEKEALELFWRMEEEGLAPTEEKNPRVVRHEPWRALLRAPSRVVLLVARAIVVGASPFAPLNYASAPTPMSFHYLK